MNIGIRLHDTAPGTLEERLGFARAQGFSCAHVALSKVLPGFEMDRAPELLNDELADGVHDAMKRAGLQCAVLGCYLSLATPDAEELARTQAIYKAHLKYANRIGALVVGTETPAAKSSKLDIMGCRSEEAFQLLLRNIRPVVRWAEEYGAILAVEPVVSYIIYNSERAERLLTEVNSDAMQIILDPVNLLASAELDQADAIFEEAMRRLGDRVRVLHMKDYRPAPENFRPDSIACGTGIMRFDALLSFAKRHDLPMTLEDTTPENAEAARKHLEAAAAAL